MRRKKTISAKAFRNFVIREARKLQKEAVAGKIEDVSKVKAKEVDADGYADTLEQDIDYIKALKIKENKIV